jgi:hypothetical protein
MPAIDDHYALPDRTSCDALVPDGEAGRWRRGAPRSRRSSSASRSEDGLRLTSQETLSKQAKTLIAMLNVPPLFDLRQSASWAGDPRSSSLRPPVTS